MSNSAFERYAPFIQEYIYRKKWADLREVQVEAAEAILDTDKHVIIASQTASGKTEAAFFPILTLLEQHPPQSIGILYISPLKALINDQFERLDELLESVEIPVWSWHGDASASQKKKAFDTARGVLQITPESLEALLMGHPSDAARLFGDLRFIVIDEIHALMGVDRGLQLLCLMNRLEQAAGCKPRRIGLSATLNDYQPAMEFLAAGSTRETVAVGIQGKKRKVSLCAESFRLPEDEKEVPEVMAKYHSFLYRSCYDKKCLIFTNSKLNAEQTIGELKKEATRRKEPDVFYVHHGNVSKGRRKEVEQALKENAGPTVAAATLTLEMGIDIGDLDSTIQLGAPYTCSSFVQRLGRSGRRTGISKMMFLSLEKPSDKNPWEAMPWDLLRSIAVIQLYLEDRWVEPFYQKQKPFSLLAHQTLSTLMAVGELTPNELVQKVLRLPVFHNKISTGEYGELLRYMLEKEYLGRMDNGGLIVGLLGEKICNYYSFYAVFQAEEAYKVVSKNGEVGSLNTCPQVGEVFVLSGCSWSVVSVDEQAKFVYVAPADGRASQSEEGESGEIHWVVMQKIKQILSEDTAYPYLQKQAAALLEKARKTARESGILTNDIVSCGEKGYSLCPWSGTRELRTIAKLFANGLKEELDIRTVSNPGYCVNFTTGLSLGELKEKLTELQCDASDADLVLKPEQAPKMDKYDYMVPDFLLRSAYLHNQVDVERAVAILNQLKW